MPCVGQSNASGYTIDGLTQRAVSTVMGYLYFLYQPRTKHYEPCQKCVLAQHCPGVLQSYDEAFPASAIVDELSPYSADSGAALLNPETT
jgi:hypothetical protein